MYQYRNRFVFTDTVMCMIVVTKYAANKTAAVSFLTCFQYTSTNVGKNGRLSPAQAPEERRLWT